MYWPLGLSTASMPQLITSTLGCQDSRLLPLEQVVELTWMRDLSHLILVVSNMINCPELKVPQAHKMMPQTGNKSPTLRSLSRETFGSPGPFGNTPLSSLALGHLFILSYWWIICFSQSWTYHRNLLSNCYIRSLFLWVWTSKCGTESSLKFPPAASQCLVIPSLSKKKSLVLFKFT